MEARNGNSYDAYVRERIIDGPPKNIIDIKDLRKILLKGVMILSLWSVYIESCCIHNLCEDLAYAQELRGSGNELIVQIAIQHLKTTVYGRLRLRSAILAEQEVYHFHGILVLTRYLRHKIGFHCGPLGTHHNRSG